MIHAIEVTNNIVTNRAVFEKKEDVFEGWIIHETAQIGWIKEGENFIPRPEPIIPQPPLLETVSKKINEVISYGDKQDAKPFEYPAGSGIYYKVTDAVLKTIALSVALNLPDTAPIPCNDGKWDNVYADISTPFTVGEFNAFYAYGYAIPEHNYHTMKAHVANIMQLTTPEEVEAYDYTKDWR